MVNLKRVRLASIKKIPKKRHPLVLRIPAIHDLRIAVVTHGEKKGGRRSIKKS